MEDNLLITYKKLLAEFIPFKTISTLDSTKEVEKAVKWLESLFSQSGFETKIVRGFDNPVIISSKDINPDYPTVLIYGHYDVQPASIEEWGTDPFSLRDDGKRIYGRGVSDNKGQMLVHLVNVLELAKDEKLKFNVKFLIEGNEETGSPNIGKLLEKYKTELKNDFILISDSSMIQNHPTIELSLRGTFNTTLTIRTSDRDLHSGLFGGSVPNASHVASEFIANLFEDGKINYKEFYKDIETVEEDLRKVAFSIPMEDVNFKRLTGTKKMTVEKGENFFSQVGLRPTIQVTGLESGYTGNGYRNSVPSFAVLKFNFRLVPNQDPEKVLIDFKNYVRSALPNYVEFEFSLPESTEGSVKPIRLVPGNNYHKKAEKLLSEIHKKQLYYDFNGATLPIVVDFQNILKSDILMVALANDDCNMHAVNENFDLQSLKKALQFSNQFLSTRI